MRRTRQSITDSKAIQSLGSAFIRVEDVLDDGNCGFRVLAEGLRSANHQHWRRFYNGDLGGGPHRRRPGTFHVSVRREMASWFEEYRAHYMGLQGLLPQSGALSYSSILAGLKGPGHRDNRRTWFTIPLHAQIFADRFRTTLVILPFPSAPCLEVYYPTTTLPGSFPTRNLTADQALLDAYIPIVGLVMYPSHAQRLVFKDDDLTSNHRLRRMLIDGQHRDGNRAVFVRMKN